MRLLNNGISIADLNDNRTYRIDPTQVLSVDDVGRISVAMGIWALNKEWDKFRQAAKFLTVLAPDKMRLPNKMLFDPSIKNSFWQFGMEVPVEYLYLHYAYAFKVIYGVGLDELGFAEKRESIRTMLDIWKREIANSGVGNLRPLAELKLLAPDEPFDLEIESDMWSAITANLDSNILPLERLAYIAYIKVLWPEKLRELDLSSLIGSEVANILNQFTDTEAVMQTLYHLHTIFGNEIWLGPNGITNSMDTAANSLTDSILFEDGQI